MVKKGVLVMSKKWVLLFITMIFVKQVFATQYFTTGSYTVKLNDPNNQDAQKTFPLMLRSSGSQHNWQAIDLLSLLPKKDAGNSSISSIRCENKTCVAVGSTEEKTNSKTSSKSFVLTSMDEGVTWSLSSIDNHSTAERKLNSVYSSQGDFYIVGELNQQPLILTSLNNGRTWEESFIANIPSDIRSGYINNINCVEKICIALGKINTKTHNNAILILRKENKTHWKYVDKIIDLPSQFRLDSTTNSSCSNDLCIIGGKYLNSQEKSIPFLLTSEDKGDSWKFNAVMSLPILSDFYTRLIGGSITSISCSPDNCFAAGGIMYRKSKEHTSSISFFLRNKRINQWEVHTETVILPSSIYCNDQNCLIEGYMNDYDSFMQIAFLVGTTKGENWQLVKMGQIGSEASINSLQCFKHACLAVGYYKENKYYKFPKKPLIITSEDTGRHWNWEKKIDHLPNNIFQGDLWSSTAS